MRRRSVEEEYAQLARIYDERWASYIASTVRLTLDRLPDHRAFSHILDVGCGTGALLAPLSTRFPSAVLAGADPSLAMLEIARARMRNRALLVAARAEALPFRDNMFDLVTSTSAMHYFTDLDAAACEMHRVTAPGGTLVITDWCRDFLSVRAFDMLMRVLGKANFTVLGTADCVSLLRRAGFEAMTVDTRRIAPLWGVMRVHARKATNKRSRRTAASML